MRSYTSYIINLEYFSKDLLYSFYIYMPEFLHVNNEDTLKKMNNNSKDKFVKYYMDGCGHCDDLEPIWKLVESRINKEHQNSDVTIVQINANFMDNANIPNVDGFPTISMIKGGKKMDHNGMRTEEAIMSFFKKHNLLTIQSGGGGKRRRKTKKKRKKSRKPKRKHKRSRKGRGFKKWVKSKLPTRKVKPQTAIIGSVKVSDDNYEEARLNRRGHELANEIRNPRSPWTQAAAEQEFDQNKRIYERKFKNVPVAEAVVEDPKIVGAKSVSNMYYNPKTNDGRNDNSVVVSSRRRRGGRRGRRVVPIGGTRKKIKSRKKSRKWSKKYKKVIDCKRPKGFSQKQYCKTRSKR